LRLMTGCDNTAKRLVLRSEALLRRVAKDTVTQVISMVDRNEYKRRQSPPGIKISPKAFGKDRRMPITNHYLMY
jgi:NAD+ synthase (glutamine-hydrolysing)